MQGSVRGRRATSEPASDGARSHLYSELAEDLRRRVTSGEFREGMLLPSEASLCEAYGISRPTVKRALDLLRSEGVIDARRGFGWFVAGTLFRQHLGALSTIEDSVKELGMVATRHVIEFAFAPAPPDVAAVLGCETVLRTKRINLADGQPVACVTTWCPENLAASLSKADVEQHSLYDLLPVEIVGARQIIRAVAVSAEDAALLNIRIGSPCLASERVTFDASGATVLTAVAIFPGHSSEYVAEMPGAGRSGRAGIRMVPEGGVDRSTLLAALQ